MTRRSAFFASVLIGAVAVIIWRLLIIRPPFHDSLARPTPLFWTEAEIVVAFFVALLVFKKPFSSFNLRLLNRPLTLPRIVRYIALFLSFAFMSVFGFWAYLDVTGGYNGGYQLDNHKWMETIYYAIHMGQFPLPPDQEGPLFFMLALGMMFVFRLNKGAWSALKDIVTFYGAPILVACELSLWYYAVEDMTWHVTSWLWVGGYNDGGWEHIASQYVFSNWIALFLCSVLILSRLPFLTLISSLVWSRVKYRRLPVIIGLAVLIALCYSAYIPLVVAWKW